MTRIAVYCGASKGRNRIYENYALKLAEWIATHHYQLVYGGGKVGLMGILADAVLTGGGQVIGVMPQFLIDREIANDRLNRLVVTKNMDERKQKMMALADCCVALPGGPGTLEEITEAFSWARVGQNDNPCVFLNVNGYYNLLRSFFDQMVTEGFLSSADRSKLLFTDQFDRIDHFIETYIPPRTRRYTR